TGLTAMVVVAEGTGLHTALAAGFRVSSRGVGIPIERPRGSRDCAGPVVGSAIRVRVFAQIPVRLAGMFGVAPRLASVVGIPVIKCPASGVVAVVVINHGPVMPIRTPVMPTPFIASVVSDSEADSKRKVGARIPNFGIRIPSRPRHDWVSVNNPWVVRGDIDDFRTGRLDDLLGKSGCPENLRYQRIGIKSYWRYQLL